MSAASLRTDGIHAAGLALIGRRLVPLELRRSEYGPSKLRGGVRMLLVIGRVGCEEGKREELVDLMKEMQDKSRREEGCIRYGFFSAVEEPNSFVAVEEWRDREALDVHFEQPHLRQFARRLLEVVSERPEVAIHEIAGTSGFPG